LTAANGPRATCRTIFIVSSLPRLPLMTIEVNCLCRHTSSTHEEDR